jgi:hypothetical protein
MRLFGYTLLLLGFVAMPFSFKTEFHALSGEIVHHANNLAREGGDAKTYTWPECRDIVVKAVREADSAIPVLWLPLVMMLAGGIILDLAGRRPRKVKHAA